MSEYTDQQDEQLEEIVARLWSEDLETAAQAFEDHDRLVDGTCDPPSLVVADSNDAVRILRRMSGLRQALDALSAPFTEEIRRLQERQEEVTRTYRQMLNWLDAASKEPLRTFALANLPDGRKSLPLPYGTLKLRQAPAKLDVTDPEAFCEWARAQGYGDELIRTKEEPNKRALASWFKGAEGEVPEGTVFVPEHTDFSVELRRE
ncbi:MAG TPA: host-nuclease inhibitor Gam family protein [Armatimonadota bacterium]|jgi:phage host-nuclease inhibitor protein Gam